MCVSFHTSGWEVKIAATHIVLLFGPRRVRFQQHCYHRLRFTALLHRGDVQRQSPILSASQAATWNVSVCTGRAGSSAMLRRRLHGKAVVGLGRRPIL